MGRTACTESQCLYSTAIPLLPLWAVRLVKSLSASTVQLYLYSPYGPYSLYRASVPVQYSYTSTPPIGRTACTESQCLYSRAIPLLLWAVRPVHSLGVCTVELYLYSYGPYGFYRASKPVQGCTLPFFIYMKKKWAHFPETSEQTDYPSCIILNTRIHPTEQRTPWSSKRLLLLIQNVSLLPTLIMSFRLSTCTFIPKHHNFC